ncbi:glycosyltransferase family 2 protein [Succinimonas sp.]|uniref:glycosyltransferase family 2 protein n=1 Tax=Succinimonas sp. TaxID=1936151 RepID=UPI00387013C9
MADEMIIEKIKNSEMFDPKWYVDLYRIAELEGVDDSYFYDKALEHYLDVGWKLGYDPSRKFSTSGYLCKHLHLKIHGINPLVYYVETGMKEKRELEPHRSCSGISVVMATYNRRDVISRAIDSVLNRKSKYDVKFELIIVIDGSTDGSFKFIHEHYNEQIASKKIVVIEVEHGGLAYARNRGVENARFDWICYVDDDNLVRDNFLDVFYLAIMTNRGSEFFYAQHLLSTRNKFTEREFDRNLLLKGNYIDAGVICHSKSIFYRAGCFDESLIRLEDWDLIIRITGLTEPVYIPEIVLDYNSSDESDRISNSVPEVSSILAIRSKYRSERLLYDAINNLNVKFENKINQISQNYEEAIKAMREECRKQMTEMLVEFESKLKKSS